MHQDRRVTVGRWTRAAWLASVLGLMVACHAPPASPLLRITDLPKLDPATASRPADGQVLWYDARELGIEGRGWPDKDGPYRRLPAKAKGTVRPDVWSLAQSTAGLFVRFVTDAERISARWTVTSKTLGMFHMAPTGMSGLDLYVRTPTGWRWIGVGRPRQSPTNEEVLAQGIPAGAHEYMLYLPLYNGIVSLQIGIPAGAILAKGPPPPPQRAKPVCIYGTSIVQGGCASRPGMAHTAILGRRLDREVINLGFSGNGRMEPEIAELLTQIDAAAYVLDALPNMTADMVTQRVEPFVQTLRQSRPDTPIVLVENIAYQSGAFVPKTRQAYQDKNIAMRQVYQRLAAQGVKRLFYVPSEALLGRDGEATVDGTHPTDLGFLRMAEALEPVLRKALPSR